MPGTNVIPIAIAAWTWLVVQTAAQELPEMAQQHSYTKRTFFSTFSNDVDLAGRGGPHFKWFLDKPFHWQPSSASELVFTTRGVVLRGDATSSNYTIGSVHFDPRGDWHGAAFGGGGYFEAEIRFDPKGVALGGPNKGFPAWWLLSFEHATQSPGEQMPGAVKGELQFGEIDVFEYPPRIGPLGRWYLGTVHAWSGKFDAECPHQYCDHSNNGKGSLLANNRIAYVYPTARGEFHRYGVLWVPAKGETPGNLRYFLDGKPTGTQVTWPASNPHGVVVRPRSPFSVLDLDHYILSFGSGSNWMEIRSVSVWQNDISQDLFR